MPDIPASLFLPLFLLPSNAMNPELIEMKSGSAIVQPTQNDGYSNHSGGKTPRLEVRI